MDHISVYHEAEYLIYMIKHSFCNHSLYGHIQEISIYIDLYTTVLSYQGMTNPVMHMYYYRRLIL